MRPLKSTIVLSATGLALLSAAAIAGSIAPAAATAAVTAQADSSHAAYTAFLEKYVAPKDGIHLVDYEAVTDADKAKLDGYITWLETMKPSTMSDDEKIAFWINLYNAKTISVILDDYPVKSIRDLGLFGSGPWKKDAVTVEGETLSLDDMEKEKVLAKFDEPRVHYAFNCASIGCPNLKTSAWEASSLDADLDEAAYAYIAHPRGVRVEGGKVTASSIFKWYRDDFGGSEEAALDHIRKYTKGDKAAALAGKTKINKYEYDWSLNDQ